MDPLSFSASIFTVLGALSATTQLAVGYRNSSKNLHQLESQLDDLQAIADKLHEHAQGLKPFDPALLHRPTEQLRNARTSFNGRFKKKKKIVDPCKSKFKRSVHTDDIKRLREEVVTIQSGFQTAMGLLTLSSLQSASVVNSYRLELSSNFSPEHCATPEPMMEPLLVYSTTELRRTDAVRVHQYFLLFAQDRRRWRRIIATITTKTNYDFVYQGVCHQGARDYALGPLHVLFRKALTDLQAQLFKSVTNLQMELDLDRRGTPRLVADCTTFTEDPNAVPCVQAAESVAEIGRRGLAVFTENDVVVIENLIQSWYLVRVGSQHYLERIVPFIGQQTNSNEDQTHDYWQKLQPMLAIQGSPFMAEFGGIIMDDARTQIRGHLIKLPERGTLSHLILAADQAEVFIPWQCKEKWIRQLATAVAEAHRRGIVIGDLALPQLWLDRNDNLVIVDLKRRSEDLQQRAGNIPPEFRGRSNKTKAEADPDHTLTFSSDIFGLGMAIWLICEQRRSALADVFCRRYPCSSLYRYRCTAPHSNPIELPTLSQDLHAPAHFDNIIQLCRQKDPMQRPSAATIIQMLTNDGLPSTCLQGQVVPVKFTAIDETKYRVYCDECAKNCTFELYSCRICDQGDFDLCPDCYADGVTCWNGEHPLHRRRRRDGQWVFDEVGVA